MSQPAPAPDRLLTRPFVLASLANLLQGMSFFAFVHLPRRLEELGADEVKIGLLMAAAAMASLLVRPAVGRQMDRKGRRLLILVGGALNLAVVPLYLTVGALDAWLVAIRVLHGVAWAITFTALATYGADQVPEARRTQGLALFGASSLVPMAVGGWVGDVTLAAGGFSALFLASAGFAAAALGISFGLTERRLALAVAPRGGGFRRALAHPQLLPLWFLAFNLALVLTGYFTFMRTFVDATGVGSLSAFFAAYAGMAVLTRTVGGSLPDRVGRRRVFYPALGAIALGFLAVALAASNRAMVAAGVLSGAGLGYAFPILFSLVVERASIEERGSAMAAFTAVFDAGTLAGSPTLGWVIHQFGYGAMFAAAAGWMAVAALVFAFWDTGGARGRDPLAAEQPAVP
ncbi:MAG: MFS transporter [Actinomycetota bacterium]